jgi:hypothetical protein
VRSVQEPGDSLTLQSASPTNFRLIVWCDIPTAVVTDLTKGLARRLRPG